MKIVHILVNSGDSFLCGKIYGTFVHNPAALTGEPNSRLCKRCKILFHELEIAATLKRRAAKKAK